ncbi:uncharacterized protein LOC116840278 [Odontomachus brunneus]|uniref:uncharacterized protein LOC116840278 n=1 Tax=Odontomachus brunneus TaxID=486640 RepID=UPI0013F22E7E|nr:uncharacterized protein LOC116840278 [Odontomachus brunneus]
MDSLIVVLIAVAVCCSEMCCDTLPATTVVNPKNAGFLMEANASYMIDKGLPLRNLDLRKPAKVEEPRNLDNTRSEANKRKARLLGGLAFLAGLSVGGLATAASSSVKTIAKMPQATFALNLGHSKTSPYFAAYYSPYSLIPYPFFYHTPFGLLPTADPAKPLQVSSHNDMTQQVISLFDNRQPGDFAENNEEYADQEKNPDSDKNAAISEDRADHRPELQTDRNAEEKAVMRGCKEAQRKHSDLFKGSPRQHENLQVGATDPPAAMGATNMTADTNQTVIRDKTTTRKPYIDFKPTFSNHTTEHPSFPGYYEGYPQDISHVDLTTGSDAYHYQDHGQINYNLPYEQPSSFYHDDTYSNHHANHPYFPGSFSSEPINGYVGTDFGRVYPSQYQTPYINSFKPVK